MKKKIVLTLTIMTLTLIMGVFFNASKLRSVKPNLVINTKPNIREIRRTSIIRIKDDEQTINQVFNHQGFNRIAIPINIFSITYRQDQDFEGANQNIECGYSLGDLQIGFEEMEPLSSSSMNLNEHSNGLDLYAQLYITEAMGAEDNAVINIACRDSREAVATNTLTFTAPSAPITIRYLDDVTPNMYQYAVYGYCDSSLSESVQVTISQSYSAGGGFGSRTEIVHCLSSNFYRAVFQLAPFPVNPSAPILVQSWLGNDSTYFSTPNLLNIEQRIMDHAISGY